MSAADRSRSNVATPKLFLRSIHLLQAIQVLNAFMGVIKVWTDGMLYNLRRPGMILPIQGLPKAQFKYTIILTSPQMSVGICRRTKHLTNWLSQMGSFFMILGGRWWICLFQ